MTAVTPQDHLVQHISKIPANEGESVNLFVREYDGTQNNQPREPVLMLHGRSVPVLAGFDLDVPGADIDYNWAHQLAAKHHYDVFMMDLQGNGRSPRPKMDDPRNANPAQRDILVPNPLPEPYTGLPNYPHQLSNTGSEEAELATVVDYIMAQPRMTTPIEFIGWSAAATAMGPYALQHPENVKSLFLLAPIFPPQGRWSGDASNPFDLPPRTQMPVSDPAVLYGFPMFVNSKSGFTVGWDRETGSPLQRDPGMGDRAWAAMMENDPIGSKWGPETSPGVFEGIHRYRNTFGWGWTNQTVPLRDPSGNAILGDRVPTIIVYGELDKTANTPATTPVPTALRFSVPALYTAIHGPNKLMFQLAGAGHSVVWERPAKYVHDISFQWLHNKGKVWGLTSGSYYRDAYGEVTPLE
ncbi:alpha/beta fold hydrolase [Streptomyces sp. NPDC058464]|uniref:alpha/beta fold hydrolase n=1 Tax=Streptomyces sp. NPDC058464 TaxID=3346511 RepID=UPI00364AE55F